jgi:hypothetical protein
VVVVGATPEEPVGPVGPVVVGTVERSGSSFSPQPDAPAASTKAAASPSTHARNRPFLAATFTGAT